MGDIHMGDGGRTKGKQDTTISSSVAVLGSWENFDHFTPKG